MELLIKLCCLCIGAILILSGILFLLFWIALIEDYSKLKKEGKSKMKQTSAKKGYWIPKEDGLYCSCCGMKHHELIRLPDTCHYCGAEMKGERK